MTGPIYAAAGGLRIDYLITRDGTAHTGLPGGNALYAAAGAILWAEPVALWAHCGQNYPRHWLAELSQLGLDTRGLITIPGHHDHRTFYAYTPDGRRDDTNPAAHFARFNLPLPADLHDYIHSTPGQDDPFDYEPLAPRPDEWPQSYKGVNAVHLSPLPLSTHLHVPPELRRRGVDQISLDPGERYMVPQRIDHIRQILPTVDAFLPSDQEVSSLFGQDADVQEAARIFRRWGAKHVIIKLGDKGVLVLGSEQERPLNLRPYHARGDARVVDVTGAGDAFCGGFLVGLHKSADAIQAAQMGMVSASLVIEGYGALYALQASKAEALRRLAIVKHRWDTR